MSSRPGVTRCPLTSMTLCAAAMGRSGTSAATRPSRKATSQRCCRPCEGSMTVPPLSKRSYCAATVASFALAPQKARLTFFPEGCHPLGTVLRTRCHSLITGFHVQDVLKGHGEALIEPRFHQSIGQGRALGQALCQLLRLVLELGRRDHPVHQANAQSLLGVDDISQQHEFHGLRRPHETRQKVGATAIRHQAHACKNLPKACGIGGNTQVSRQGDVASSPDRYPIDTPNDGFGEPLQAKDTAIQAFDNSSPEVTVKKELLALSITLTLLVAARGKCPPRTCEDHRPHRGICLKSHEQVLQLCHHRFVHSIESFRAVEGEGHDTVVLVIQHRAICHARAPCVYQPAANAESS